MNEDELKEKIVSTREDFKDIEQAEIMIRGLINSERQSPPTDSSEYETKLMQAKAEQENIENSIKSYKSEATELKNQISIIKKDFEQTPIEKKQEICSELTNKIKPLGEKIIECESAICALEMRKFATEQAVSQIEISLEAFKAGYHEKPIDEDPRLKELLKEKVRLAGKLEKAEAGFTK